MNKLFGFATSEPSLTAHTLYPYRKLLKTSKMEAPCSWGIALKKPQEEIILKRRPSHFEEVDIFPIIEQNQIFCGLAHLSNTIRKNINNTMPFRYKPWYFCLLAKSEHLDKIKELIAGSLPQFLKRNIQGTLEEEFIFHLFLSYLHDSRIINQYDISIIKLSESLTQTFRTWQLFIADLGLVKQFPAVMMATNGSLLISRASADKLVGFKIINGIRNICSYCRDQKQKFEIDQKHKEVKSLFITADLDSNPENMGLKTLPKNTTLLYYKNKIQIVNE
ncbi:MAG: class II glutamine amidotransferase [Myxococcota bacterium]